MIPIRKNIFRNIDIFGIPITLNLDGEGTVKSFLGGCMTFCLVVLIGITFGIYSQNCFFKLDPQIIVTTDYYKEKENEKLFLNQTYFRFKIVSNEGKPKYIDTTPYLVIGTTNTKIQNCKKNENAPENGITFPPYNQSILTDVFYCVDLSDKSQALEYTEFFPILICDKDKICENRMNSENFLRDNIKKVEFYFDNPILNINNYTNPIQNGVSKYFTVLIPNNFVQYYTRFTPYQLTTDDGFLYSNKYVNIYNKAEKILPMFDDNPQIFIFPNNCVENPTTCNLLTNISIRQNEKIFFYERVYKRVSDALADTGGISSILMTVFNVIMNIYCTFIYDEKIANRIYHFDLFTDKHDKEVNFRRSLTINRFKEKAPKTSFKINENENKTNGFAIENNKSCEPNLELQLLPLDRIIRKRMQKNYRFKFTDLISYYLCCHSKKDSNLKKQFESFKKVKIATSSLLDITQIVSQHQIIDDLKMIFLNDVQYALMNFISKFNLVDNIDAIKNNHKYNINKNFLKNEENLRNLVNEYLLKLKNSENLILDPITSKLIDYIDENLLDNII